MKIHSSALTKGTILGEFTITRLLGSGRFGLTYLGTDKVLQDEVVLKEYFPSAEVDRAENGNVIARTTEDAEIFEKGLEHFFGEARRLARFSHPSIMGVRRVFKQNGTAYLVSKYETGQTLKDLIDTQDVSYSAVDTILNGLLGALKQLHDNAVLHRDIKPANIIIKADKTPILIDFGASREFSTDASRSQQGWGTTGYAPVEQYAPGIQQGPWTDLYAVGAVLYRILCGRKPHDALTRLENDPLPTCVSQQTGDWPYWLAPLVDRFLAVMPADRPHSVDEVQDLMIELKATAQTPNLAPKLTLSDITETEADEQTQPLPVSHEIAPPSNQKTSKVWLWIAFGSVAAAGAALIATGIIPPSAIGLGPKISDVPPIAQTIAPSLLLQPSLEELDIALALPADFASTSFSTPVSVPPLYEPTTSLPAPVIIDVEIPPPPVVGTVLTQQQQREIDAQLALETVLACLQENPCDQSACMQGYTSGSQDFRNLESVLTTARSLETQFCQTVPNQAFGGTLVFTSNDVLNCPSPQIVSDGSIADGRITFTANFLIYTGRIDQTTGEIEIVPNGISPEPLFSISVSGNVVDGAIIESDLCGTGRLQILGLN
jgi:serine/threonine protein kinase